MFKTLACLLTASNATQILSDPMPSTYLMGSQEKEAFTELNQIRTHASHPSPALFWSDCVALAADDHCTDIAKSQKIGRKGEGNSSPRDRINGYDLKTHWRFVVDEVDWASTMSATGMIDDMYMESGKEGRELEKSMLNKDMTVVGMAYCDTELYLGGHVLVVDFATDNKPNGHCRRSAEKRSK